MAYGYDQNGKVVAQSQSTQAAAEALLRSGASLKDMVTVLGDEGIQGAFDGVDQANAYLASNPDRLQAAFDDFAGTSPAGVQQSGPSAFVDADGILNITVTGEKTVPTV